MKSEVFINLKLTFYIGVSMRRRSQKTNPNHQNDKHCKIPGDFSKGISTYLVFNVAKIFESN